jgi:hypothetical protein
MKLLNNIFSNHYNEIKNILLDADELKIISPFLMESFDEFFSQLHGVGIKYISLTTTLKDNDPDLLKKSNSLYSFCFNCQKNNISYSVRIDNKLHGKIYIFLKLKRNAVAYYKTFFATRKERCFIIRNYRRGIRGFL